MIHKIDILKRLLTEHALLTNINKDFSNKKYHLYNSSTISHKLIVFSGLIS